MHALVAATFVLVFQSWLSAAHACEMAGHHDGAPHAASTASNGHQNHVATGPSTTKKDTLLCCDGVCPCIAASASATFTIEPPVEFKIDIVAKPVSFQERLAKIKPSFLRIGKSRAPPHFV